MTKKRLIAMLLVLILWPLSRSLAAYDSMLAPTSFTPSTYIEPEYDPFNPNYAGPLPEPEAPTDTAPIADFTITHSQLTSKAAFGLPSNSTGTTATEFLFDASPSYDAETPSSALQVRWDFENDGKLDRYFSVTKSVRHRYTKPGIYQVKLEVLDDGGNVSSTVKTVTVVNNTAPLAAFSSSPVSGTEGTAFLFKTNLSSDDQYVDSALQYRFDWNGDGKWDTPFQSNTQWSHRFGQAGTYHVIMEVRDPGGLKAQASTTLQVRANTPPHAQFTIRSIRGNHGTTFEFDASGSSDAETPHDRLMYRWDFNYHGPDDIMYSTAGSTSDRYSGNYDLSGKKIIRLEVTDSDGAKDYAYASIDVSEADIAQ